MVWQGQFDKVFIGGRWVPSTGSDRIRVISPFSEELVAEVPDASVEDAERAVQAARHAFDSGPWPGMPLERRIEVLRAFSAAMAEHEEFLASLVTDEMGCPIP